MTSATATKQRHILVIEDDTSIAELLAWVLAEAGYRVSSAGSLREARRICGQFKPDVIVADLLLPDGLGSDLLYEMVNKHNGSRPPAIVMSALPQARQHADAAGAQVCLSKPFDLTEFLEAVRQLLESHGRGD
jgi:DNA-binding response OmpR family regulator